VIDRPEQSDTPAKFFAGVSMLACFVLGAIALYSAGIGLIDPKLHRSVGFALALIAAVALSRKRSAAKRAKKKSTEQFPVPRLIIDLLLIVVGLWSIWSFYFVQNEMETALYDISTKDAWPAMIGLMVFLELCRRLWGWGLFLVGSFGVIYLLFGQNLPGILEHSGFSLKEVAEAL